jgi:hypothetical protein
MLHNTVMRANPSDAELPSGLLVGADHCARRPQHSLVDFRSFAPGAVGAKHRTPWKERVAADGS